MKRASARTPLSAANVAMGTRYGSAAAKPVLIGAVFQTRPAQHFLNMGLGRVVRGQPPQCPHVGKSPWASAPPQEGANGLVDLFAFEHET